MIEHGTSRHARQNEGGRIVIVEYVRYAIASGHQAEFEEAYARAQEVLMASPHCVAYELARCTDAPTDYVLRIEWDSADGHLVGFRQGSEFPGFLKAIGPFVPNIQEMRHYEATTVRATKDLSRKEPL